MCGICGFVGFKNDKLLFSMMESISHRGLDDEGYYVDDKVSLGFRRLSTIDLEKGYQPISNEDNTVWSVCNGEIYNFKELRYTLQKRGHIFKTDVDVEIIPHAYEEWGYNFVKYLDGMFVFALWDKTTESLFLGRDRLGMRPLYYIFSEGRLLFASEIKALFKNENCCKELNYTMIDDFLTFRYVPDDGSLFNKIRGLSPATLLIFFRGDLKIIKYWDFTMSKIYFKMPLEDIIDIFLHKLSTAVKKCLTAEVPIGVYLSGGIDSSVIAALSSTYLGKNIKAFSHGFDEKEDELKYARKVTKSFEISHHEVFIKEKHFQYLPKIIYHLEMPIANSDIIGFYLLSWLAQREGVKVVLIGEGADELFGGYVHQEALYYGYKVKRILSKIGKSIISKIMRRKLIPLCILNKLFRYPGYSLDSSIYERLSYYFLSSTLGSDYFCITSLFTKEEKEFLYSKEFKELIHKEKKKEYELECILDDESLTKEIFNKLIYVEFKYWLPTYHLIKEDKIAMIFGLESRYPYLDYDLVEFAFQIPVNLKIRGFTRKWLLRNLAKRFLPKEIVHRQKCPVMVPIEKCFDNVFDIQLNELLSKANVRRRGYFNYDYIRYLIDDRKKRPFLRNRQLFALLVLEIWHQIFIDGKIKYG